MYINTLYEQDRQFTITGGKKIRRILNLRIIEIAPTYTDKMFAYGGPPPNFPPPAEQLGQPAVAGFKRRRPPHPPARRERWLATWYLHR
jgi:hypothetical protein